MPRLRGDSSVLRLSKSLNSEWWLLKFWIKRKERINKVWKAENLPLFVFFLFFSLFSNLGSLARANCLVSGRSSSSVICKHCLMHVCADTQKTDWTHPPVPDTAPCVCHGLLAQILDRTPRRLSGSAGVCTCVSASVCVSVRDERKTDLAAALFCPATDSR